MRSEIVRVVVVVVSDRRGEEAVDHRGKQRWDGIVRGDMGLCDRDNGT